MFTYFVTDTENRGLFKRVARKPFSMGREVKQMWSGELYVAEFRCINDWNFEQCTFFNSFFKYQSLTMFFYLYITLKPKDLSQDNH